MEVKFKDYMGRTVVGTYIRDFTDDDCSGVIVRIGEDYEFISNTEILEAV